MSQPVYYTYFDSPLGPLLMTSDGESLTAIAFPCHHREHAPGDGWRRKRRCFVEVSRQLEAYFAGRLRDFDLPLALGGSPFERRVWNALRTIPYGKTVAYRDIAERIGKPTACRAVGLANGRNPIPIIVPCHRVIGSNGSLTGYGGGLDTKRWLLAHEGVLLETRRQQTFLAGV